MKASVEEVNTVQRRITVELSENDVNDAFGKVYQRLKKKVQIKGFRPGKAPLTMIRKFYGASAAYDVANQLVESHLFPAIQEQSLKPVAAPVLETSELPSENEGYSFTALVDIMPEIKVDGYKGLELDYHPITVDDATVEREIEGFQKRQAKRKEAAEGATADKGCVAKISQTATLDGEDFPPYKLESVEIELGNQGIIEEIEKNIFGLKVGESTTFSLKIHDQYPDEELVGKEISCELTLEGLEELTLPEVNDDFAKDAGFEAGLEAMKEQIRTQLDKQAEQNKRQQLETKIFEKLSESHDFEVPPSMVDTVIDSIIDDMERQAQGAQKFDKKDEQLRQSLRDQAKSRTKNTLILQEVVKLEKLEVSDEDLDKFIRELIPSANDQEDDKLKDLKENLKKSLDQGTKDSLLFRKALDLIVETASLKPHQH